MNGKNNIDACSYHDGPLIDVRVNNEDMIHLDKHGLDVSFIKLDAKNRQEMLRTLCICVVFKRLTRVDAERVRILMSKTRKTLLNINAILNDFSTWRDFIFKINSIFPSIIFS